MGCWISTPNEGGGGGGEKKGFSLTNEDGKYKTSAWTTEFKESNWTGDTENIWGRKLGDLSAHMDLPRLGHKMRIFRNGERVMINPSTKVGIVHDILTTLTRELEETEEILAVTNEKFYDFVHQDGSGDISQQLLNFLTEYYSESSKIQSVLCLCHQKIVFPAFYSIKSHLFEDLPFRDARASWVVSVYIEPEACTVVHCKTQLAKEQPGEQEPEFSFSWELVLQLTGERLHKVSSISVRISSITTRAGVPQNRIDAITGIIQKHYEIGPYNPDDGV